MLLLNWLPWSYTIALLITSPLYGDQDGYEPEFEKIALRPHSLGEQSTKLARFILNVLWSHLDVLRLPPAVGVVRLLRDVRRRAGRQLGHRGFTSVQ